MRNLFCLFFFFLFARKVLNGFKNNVMLDNYWKLSENNFRSQFIQFSAVIVKWAKCDLAMLTWHTWLKKSSDNFFFSYRWKSKPFGFSELIVACAPYCVHYTWMVFFGFYNLFIELRKGVTHCHVKNWKKFSWILFTAAFILLLLFGLSIAVSLLLCDSVLWNWNYLCCCWS